MNNQSSRMWMEQHGKLSFASSISELEQNIDIFPLPPLAVVPTISARPQKPKNAPLGDNFVPGPYDVICGRGKECYNHVGNRRFRVTIEINVDRYTKAKTRVDKSLIVIEIVDTIRNASANGGGFVKKDKTTGKWVNIGDNFAREKVGHCLRDVINTRKSVGGIAAATASVLTLGSLNTGRNNKKKNNEKIPVTPPSRNYKMKSSVGEHKQNLGNSLLQQLKGGIETSYLGGVAPPLGVATTTSPVSSTTTSSTTRMTLSKINSSPLDMLMNHAEPKKSSTAKMLSFIFLGAEKLRPAASYHQHRHHRPLCEDDGGSCGI